MNILEKICYEKKKSIENNKAIFSIDFFIKKDKKKEIRNFVSSIKKNEEKFNIITEIKRKSPSAGLIKKNFNLTKIACDYEDAGARCLSILTEEKYFGGNLNFIKKVKEKVSLPILRKDFIIDKYQILESKIYQSDCILLILSILSDTQATEFISYANELNLDCIIEVHNEEELKRAIKLDYPVIGINNRNLKSLEINLNNSINLNKNLTNDYILIAESGIKNSDDIKKFNSTGIYNFLIGESLLKSKNKEKKIGELLLNESYK